jgi:hypothetical protein
LKIPDWKGALTWLFLILNGALIAFILMRAPKSCTGTLDESTSTKAQDTGIDKPPRRDPTAHLPLMGMAGFDGDTEDACMRMKGYLLDMDFEIAKADLTARVPVQAALAEVKNGLCTINAPEIAKVVALLNKARVGAGLAEVPSR